MSEQPVGLHCPVCDQPPVFVFDDGHQCWCRNEDCWVLTWDAHRSRAELLADPYWIDLQRG